MATPEDTLGLADYADALNVDELSAELRIHRSTLYYWMKKGDAPISYKIGNSLKFRRADVDAWLASRITHQAAAS